MKKLIIKNFFLFSFPSSLVRIVPFIILPVTSKYFTLNQFGLIVLFEVLIIPFYIFMGFGSNHAINSAWISANLNEKKSIIFSLLFTSFFYWFFCYFIIYINIENILSFNMFSELKIIDKLNLFIFLLSFSLIPGITFSCWAIIENKYRLFVFLRLFQFLFLVLVSIFLTLKYQKFEYLILSKVVTSFFISLIELFILIKFSKIYFSISKIIEIIKLSSSFLIKNLFYLLKHQFDRLFISYLYGPSSFVIYSYSSKFLNFFTEVSEHFQNACNPKLYDSINNQKNISDLKFIFASWSILIILLNSFFVIFGGYFIDWASNGIFINSVPIIHLFSCVILSHLLFLGNFEILLFHKQNKFLSIVSFFHGVLTILLGYVSIMKFDLVGGVFSVWLSNFIFNLICLYRRTFFSKIYFNMKFLIPFIIIYHTAVLLSYFEFFFESYLILFINSILLIVVYYMFFKDNINKVFIIFSKFLIKDITTH